VDIDEDTRVLTTEITNYSSLPDSERTLTLFCQKCPDFETFEQKDEERKVVITKFVPEKARLDTIERNDVDTPFGWLLEIIFEKRKVIDKSKLRGKQNAHVSIDAKSTVPLAHQHKVSEKISDEASNDNDSNNDK
jgi:hypothetical protein